MDLNVIKGENSEAADMLSRNKLTYKPHSQVNTSSSEAMTHEMYVDNVIMPIDYLCIFTYQQDDEELKGNRTKYGTVHSYRF